ncbi:MAG: DUF4405 domain-containing protein [Deltaproteobacteria bacterium]|nr:DUF4405 domain-containing protein [Deltaproteobacteria bacterium]
MDKPRLNFLIDALMFLCLMAMAGLGFLMKYTLPPGRVARAKYGAPVEITWLGWDRHDWGDIHLYLAFTLLGLLTLHIILHWKQILGLFERFIPQPGKRTRIALAFLILAVLLLYFPFLITPKVQERGRGRGGGRHGALESPGKITAAGFEKFKVQGSRFKVRAAAS